MTSVDAFCVLVGASLTASALNYWDATEMMLLAAGIVGGAHGLHHIWTRRIGV